MRKRQVPLTHSRGPDWARLTDLSGDMALRLEKAFGVRMETLMRMQSSYDIVRTRQREHLITVRRYLRRVA
jgi:plasmid maintenance system antidote protein VapI